MSYTENKPVRPPALATVKKGQPAYFVPRLQDRKADAENVSKSDELKVQAITAHLLEIGRAAQERRNYLSIMRGTGVLMMIPFPTGIYLSFSNVTESASALTSLASEFTIAVTAASFSYIGLFLNKEFEKAMLTQTRILEKAENQLVKFRQSGFQSHEKHTATYTELRRKERAEIDARIKNKKFRNDSPTRNIRRMFFAATAAIAVTFVSKNIDRIPEVLKELDSLIEENFKLSKERIPKEPVLKKIVVP